MNPQNTVFYFYFRRAMHFFPQLLPRLLGKKLPKRSQSALGIFGAFLSFALCFLPAASLRAEIIEEIYYVVRDKPITKLDFESALKDARAFPSGNVSDEVLSNTVISNLILESLVTMEMEDKGVRVNSEEVEAGLQRMMRENNIESDEQMESALQQQGITLAQLKRQIQRNLIFQNYIRNELQVLPPNRKEITDYLKNNINRFQIEDPVLNLHALRVRIPNNAGFTQRRKTQAEIQKIQTSIAQSAASVELLKSFASEGNNVEYSHLSWVLPSIFPMVAANWETLWQLSAGDISPVMQIDNAFIVFYIEDMRKSGTIPEELAYKLVENELFAVSRQKALDEKIASIFAQQVIEKRTDLFEFNP